MNKNNNTNISKFNLSSGTNHNPPLLTLNDGYQIPIIGLGTTSLHNQTCKNAIKAALEIGIRLFDTASLYGNEKEVGETIRESNINRNEIFVITKLYPGAQFANPEKAIEEALNKLNTDYIDMMLLHHPGENDVKAYKAIEKYIEKGKIKSVGLSNWYIKEINSFLPQINIKPSLIQNEIHIYYQEKEVVPYMHNLNIAMQAWYPFGGRGHTFSVLNNPTIVSIAKDHNKTSAQIISRWLLQRGIITIVGSSNPIHIKENISVFDFELSNQEMELIASLDKNEKHDWY
ncbi:aldo/keto reductase [Malacoplasma penetrans]|nr:aldo/keto reductase [Malacoplasma penetrans]RXY97261.1 aldo/keto reductase [Malacoplasma penetrans]